MRQNKVICDRCGNEIGVGIVKPFVTMQLRGILLGEQLQRELDLCVPCYDKFKKWVGKK